jgi:hypothetical protein
VQVISQLTEKWSVQIPVVSLYEGPTVGALAKIITQLVAPGTDTGTEDDTSRARGERLRERRRRRVPEKEIGGAES